MVDVVILTRDGRIAPNVLEAVRQQDVVVQVHRVVGGTPTHDECRWEIVARARNAGKVLGTNPWLMFVDDDVELGANCITDLLAGLRNRPSLGALAADYLDERPTATMHRHIGMGATLFRRSVLDRVSFRWESKRCECQCLCDDLRRNGIGIEYHPTARARHLRVTSCKEKSYEVKSDECCVVDHELRSGPASGKSAGEPHVLAAFDRNHLRGFLTRFLPFYRRAGNHHPIIACTYGLTGADILHLQREGVSVVNYAKDRDSAALNRLRDFQTIVQELPPSTPVAYWDAADVLFQASLRDLWTLVDQHPGKLLVVAEPQRYGICAVNDSWINSISDESHRRRVQELLSEQPIFNGGFAAGTADTLLSYLRGAYEIRHSPLLAGTEDWGDQTAMNIYCRRDPNRFVRIAADWNYCLCGPHRREVAITEDAQIIYRDNRRPIPVVHGVARALEYFWACNASHSTVI